MDRLITKLVFRMIDAHDSEMMNWGVKKVHDYLYIVDRKILAPFDSVPKENRLYHFRSEEVAEFFVKDRCFRAALIHLVYFWRKYP